MTTNTGIASGTLPNGQSYGTSLSQAALKEILLGGGYFYMMSVNGLTAMPTDAEIEVEANNVGVCNSGFKINYKPKTAKVKNQFGQIVRTFVVNEDFTTKTGIVSWDVERIQQLSTATYIQSEQEKRAVFTGTGSLDIVLVRFVHKTAEGNIIRFTTVAEAGAGFGLEFGDKPTTINAELTSINYFNNFLAEVRETFAQPIPTTTN